jgi:hypothetical protein
MVAAWIRAETGVEHRIADGEVAAARHRVHVGEAHRTQVPGEGEHAQQEARIADAVDDERLIGRVTCGFAMEIETDQQVRAEPHTFPAYEHQGVVVGHDERQHGEHEQVQVPEESVVPAFMGHVAGGVNMDEQADARDKQEPDAGERIKQEADLRLEVGGETVFGGVGQVAGVAPQPCVHDLLDGLAGSVSLRVLPNCPARHDEGERHGSDAYCAHGLLLQLLAEEEHEDRSGGGQ